ncbi:MAG: glycosyltransferase [Niabella sp.]
MIKLTPVAGASGVSVVENNQDTYPHLHERWIYYPKKHTVTGKLRSYYSWLSLYKNEIALFIEKNGLPDLVHVHIPFKAGLIARWVKKKYRIPYVVTEHWDGYNHIVADNFYSRNFLFKRVIAHTFKNADGVHSVSDYLGIQINRAVGKMSYCIINNVADESVFSPLDEHKEEHRKFQLLHVSNGAEKKNVQGIIDAFLKLDGTGFALTIVGLPQQMNEVYKLKYPQVDFSGKMPYEKIAEEMRNAAALVIFSNSENAPCIIGEAFCCGLPVIATKVGGIPELVDHSNGILVKAGDVEGLKTAVLAMRANYKMYDMQKIAADAKGKFGYDVIGKQFNAWYNSILKIANK